MDSLTTSNELPKIVKVLSHRSARFFFRPNDAYPAALVETRSATGSISHDNPMVVTAVAAGVIGVTIVILIIFTVWIRRRCYEPEEMRLRLAANHSRAQSPNLSLNSTLNGISNPSAVVHSPLKTVPKEVPTSDDTLTKVQVV